MNSLFLFFLIGNNFSSSSQSIEKLSNREIDSVHVHKGGNLVSMAKNINREQKSYLKSIKNDINPDLKRYKLYNTYVNTFEDPNLGNYYVVTNMYLKGIATFYTETSTFYNVY